MSFAEAEKLALGRVWTGRQAQANGLIDEVGGLARAIAVARELAKIPADRKVTVAHFPVKKGLLQSLLDGKADEEGAGHGRAGLAPAMGATAYSLLHGELRETWRFLTVTPLKLANEWELE